MVYADKSVLSTNKEKNPPYNNFKKQHTPEAKVELETGLTAYVLISIAVEVLYSGAPGYCVTKASWNK